MIKIANVIGYTALFLSQSAWSATYDYTAEIRGSTKMTGVVVAAGINWQCKNVKGKGQCTTSGPWPTPGVSACAALAQKVGEIRYYGHKKKKLSKNDLQRCNKGLASTQQPKLATPLAGAPKSSSSNTPLSISNTDVSKLQGLKGLPQTNQTRHSGPAANKPTTSANKLPAVQTPSTDLRGGKSDSIPRLENKLGGPGLDRDQLRNTARDKRESLTDLKGGRSIVDPHPTTGKSGVLPQDKPKLDGKLGSIQPGPLQPLKGDATALGDARFKSRNFKSRKQGSILPPDTPNPNARTGATLRDPRLKLRKSSDLSALKGSVPSGSRLSDKNKLQTSKNIDLGKLQPLNTNGLNKPNTISKPGTVALPAVKGLTPPPGAKTGGNLPIYPGGNGPDGLPAEQGDPRDVGRAINEYLHGPRIEQIGGFQNCARAQQTITVQGNRFGSERNGRRVMLAYLGRPVVSLSVASWDDNRITAQLPAFSNAFLAGRTYEVGIQSAAGEFWASNVYRGVLTCPNTFQIVGTLSAPEECNPEQVTLYVSPASASNVYENSIVSQAFTSPGRYSINVPGPGSYKVALNPHRFCTGRWQPGPGETVLTIPPERSAVTLNFNYAIDYQRQLRSVSIVRMESTTLRTERGEYCNTSPPYASPYRPLCKDLEFAIRTPIEVVLRAATRVCSLPRLNLRVQAGGSSFTLTHTIRECLEPGVEHTAYFVASMGYLNPNRSNDMSYCTYAGNACLPYIRPGGTGTISAYFDGLTGTFNAEFAVGQHPTSTNRQRCLLPLDDCETRYYPMFATHQTAVRIQ